MKHFIAHRSLVCEITCLLMSMFISPTNSNIYTNLGHLNGVQLPRRQNVLNFSEFPNLFENISNYPTLPLTDASSYAKSAEVDISSSFVGKPLIPGIDCKNCSTQGGFFVQYVPAASDSIDKRSSGWSLGVFTKGLSAHIEINSSLTAGPGSQFSFIVKENVLDTIRIGHDFVVTPKLAVELIGGIQVLADVDFSWGFDIVVHDGAPITFKGYGMAELSMETNGFDIQMDRIPFSASISTPQISLFLGLRFNFFLAVSAISSEHFYAGLYLDMPHVETKFHPVSNVSASCENITFDGNGPSSQVAFPNLLYIEPQTRADYGATVAMAESKDEVHFHKIAIDKDLAALQFNFPSQCLEWTNSSDNDGVFGKPDVDDIKGGDTDGIVGVGTGSATRTANGSSATFSPGAGPSSAENSPSTLAETSPAPSPGTSTAAAEIPSNTAGKRLILSNETRFGIVAGMFIMVLVAFGLVME